MKIAIIGGGISGLVAGYLLKDKHQVTLFEKNDYLGGHTATKVLPKSHQNLAIDTGFIVFNDRTYPNFKKFLQKLKVEYQDTQMSYSVSNSNNGLEYNGHSLATLFADKKNLFNRAFYQLLFDIRRFNKETKLAFEQDKIEPNQTLGQYLIEHGYNDYFKENYLMSMGAAIWSASIKEMESFPLLFFVRFFINHGLLDLTNRPQWHVIKGGSHEYVKAWKRQCAELVTILPEAKSVARQDGGILVSTADKIYGFDQVIFACHSDEALALLGKGASATEKSVLGAIPYKANEVVLHTDVRRLPKHKKAWAAWNYMLDNKDSALPTLTYNMNILQGIASKTTYCVSLNQTDLIKREAILGRYYYSHPVFNQRSLTAQKHRDKINGQNQTFFCGAYWYNGFHEDGVVSALDVVKALGGDEL